MSVSVVDIVVWVIVGLLAGSLTGIVIKRRKRGFGPYVNLGIGLVGALIGGFLFDLLNIDLGLAKIAISLQDIVAAFTGSLLFLAILFLVRGWYRKGK
ncbi:MAG: GlsB/YeaQ/YmgE family stress response membrane protein [Thermodesulfobacteriota bacterium]